jgi:hypothetical protein
MNQKTSRILLAAIHIGGQLDEVGGSIDEIRIILRSRSSAEGALGKQGNGTVKQKEDAYKL